MSPTDRQREGVRMLVETGWLRQQGKLAAQRQKAADKRWREAGKTLKRIRKGR